MLSSYHLGATVWITYFAFKSYPLVILASPSLQPCNVLHSSNNSGPATSCIAPSTPPPPNKELLAALTMASTSNLVISPFIISIFSYFLISLP